MHLPFFRKLVYILFLCAGINACNNEKKSDIQSIQISPEISNVPCPISKIVSEMGLVHLETTPQCFMGYFSFLIFLDDKTIIFKSNKSILVFDNRGKFLSKIESVGKGPGEYQTIVNAFVDQSRRTIYVVDYKDIKIYTFEGRYIKTILIPFPPGGLFRRGNGDLIVVCQQKYNNPDRDMLYLLDSLFDVSHVFKSMNHDICKDIQQNLFFAGTPYEIDGHLFYIEPFVDTIYEICDTTLKPHWRINLGKYKCETKDGINISNNNRASHKRIPMLDIFETKSYFFIGYIYNQAKYMSIYDKNLKKLIFHQKYTQEDFPDQAMPIFGIKNDIIKNAPSFWPGFVKNNLAIEIVSPASLNNEQLKEFNCKVGDNPILFIGTLKQ